MSADDTAMSGRSHPRCWTGDRYVHDDCRVPSGRQCIEDGCFAEAGTSWSPYWCPKHDVERLDRIEDGLREMEQRFTEDGA